MGFTHYWHRPGILSLDIFKQFSKDAHNLALACEIPIAKDYDEPTEPPIFNEDVVRFNGIGDDGHETFSIPRVMKKSSWQTPDEYGRLFDFCKTARKPYDTLVCAVLIAFKYHFEDQVEISSDGNWDGVWYGPSEWNGKEWVITGPKQLEPEWVNGRHLYERVFPERPLENILPVDD